MDKTLTPKQMTAILEALKRQHCLGPDGRIGTWPKWFTGRHLHALWSAGLVRHEFYGPATYGHTEYFVIEPQQPDPEPAPEYPQVWTPDGMQHTFTAPDEPIQPNLF